MRLTLDATYALDPQPTFTSAVLNDPAHPIFQNYAFNASPRADYVGAAYDGNGSLWAGVVRQLGKPAGDGTVQTTGYVATVRARPDVLRHRAMRRHRRVIPRHRRR